MTETTAMQAISALPDAGVESPALVCCPHGTNDPEGRAAIRTLLADVFATRPDIHLHEAFVDVQEPSIGRVVKEVTAPYASAVAPRDAVVVPLLLSAGFHVCVDIAAAVSSPGPGYGAAVAAGALGPDPRLAELLAARLGEAGVRPGDAVVLAAAGSSDTRAVADVERVAADLRAHHDGPVTIGYGSIAKPSVADAVQSARADLASRESIAESPRVVVAAYLLAPGFFYGRIKETGADTVTAPLAPDPRLTEIVLDRYAEAVCALNRG